MTANEARSLFSEYVEGSLDVHEKDELQAFLAANPDSAAELMQFERTLSAIHQLPPHEPTLDMWTDFAPKLAAYQAEAKMDPSERLRHRWADFRSTMSEGVILWTHALATRTQARFGKYLLRNPLGDTENE